MIQIYTMFLGPFYPEIDSPVDIASFSAKYPQATDPIDLSFEERILSSSKKDWNSFIGNMYWINNMSDNSTASYLLYEYIFKGQLENHTVDVSTSPNEAKTLLLMRDL